MQYVYPARLIQYAHVVYVLFLMSAAASRRTVADKVVHTPNSLAVSEVPLPTGEFVSLTNLKGRYWKITHCNGSIVGVNL